ncbi:hypothetical protein UNPF46_11490 [Bradyrhizobium sp. UNPF46]|uniref:hypothetical protein n=1 Tax=Bradyrhizobium sp. UNPF46 TaxID=1141168 RepID=UPI00114EDDCE|nr:hypothetical protein [Bradyrhizobium sp. UNPF46]TQF40081.1 hypothetical protein UNPF46_11490 [Bradyrhizobium sp. UNPF46]
MRLKANAFAKVAKLTLCATFVLTAQAASARVLDEEPAPGMLKPGQKVYVRCGQGMAMLVTGGNNMKGGKGAGRQHGPCVPFKG